MISKLKVKKGDKLKYQNGLEFEVDEVDDIGEVVICDICNRDFTNSNLSGGFLFGSYAYCPFCADERLSTIKKHNEENHIKAWCPENKSFRDWILEDIRQGNNLIIHGTF